MGRAVTFTYGGREHCAFCPAAAVFEIYERYEVHKSILEDTGCTERTRKGWETACELLAILCRWGELWRRQLGEEPRDILTAAELRLASVTEYAALRRVLAQALVLGFKREVEDDDASDEVDLVLQELDEKQKKTVRRRGRSIWRSRRGRSVSA